MEQKLAEISSNKAELLEAIRFLIEKTTNDHADANDSTSKEEIKLLTSSFRSNWPSNNELKPYNHKPQNN
jgi:hypothetical protein